MSLNDIRLTPHQVADLYTDVLLDLNENTVSQKPVSFLGRNEKNILIITSVSDAVFVADKQLAFLTTVLEACGLGLADVAIVNWMKSGEQGGPALEEELRTRTVILFDLSPVDFGLPVNFPHFQVQEFNKRIYMHAPSLAQIESDVALKKQLWGSLKKIFCL